MMIRILSFILLLTVGAADATAAPLSQSDEQTYRTAFALLRQGKWTEARQAAAAARDQLLATVIVWLDYQEPGRGGTFSELNRFLEIHPDWPQRAALRREAERQMPADLPPRIVEDWFRTEPPLAGPGAMKLALALTALGKTDEADRLVRSAWIELPFSPPEERAFASTFAAVLHPTDHLHRLDRLLWEGDEAGARRMFVRVDAGSRALAEARLALRDMSSGADRAIKRVPAVLKADPGLIFERARWQRRKEKYDAAAQLLDRPPLNTPYLERVWVERDDAARHALARDPGLAYRLAKNHGLTSGLAFADGEFLAGWIALRFLKEPHTALKHFELLYAGVSSSISAARGAYWAGRAAAASDDQEKARQWYMLAARHTATYYGQLAARQLGWGEFPPAPPPPPTTPEGRTRFLANELVEVVRQLEQAGGSEWTKPFFQRLIGEASRPEDYVYAAELAAELKRYDLALAAAKAARRGEFELSDHLFPVRALPPEAGPENALLLAVMRQESAFDPAAISSAGARGLMQLMPVTAQTVARQNGLAFAANLLTDDPDYNIRLGSAYLASLLADYGGSYVLALAAYNAGPSRVQEWIAENGDPRDPKVDAVDWVESIPLAETRNYVQRIMETLPFYRQRLQPDRIAITLDEDLKR